MVTAVCTEPVGTFGLCVDISHVSCVDLSLVCVFCPLSVFAGLWLVCVFYSLSVCLTLVCVDLSLVCVCVLTYPLPVC